MAIIQEPDREKVRGHHRNGNANANDNSVTPLPEAPFFNHDISTENMAAACKEFIAIVGSDNVTSDYETLRAHSSTIWSPAPPSQTFALIVLPRSTREASEIMKICSRRMIPCNGYCGGTSFAGALTATRGGICIDFNRMQKIVAIHSEDMDVVVQPGIGWQELNAVLEKQGLFFPPDPGPGARIGGMVGILIHGKSPNCSTCPNLRNEQISQNCSGTNAYRHGTMRKWVISMTVVLADGTIVKTRNRPRKSSAGYDLTSLIVGSEGTLGLVTEAVLKVTSVPKNQHVIVAAFPNTHEAVKAAIALIQHGLPIDALELLDKNSMNAINRSGFSSRHWEEKPSLFLKISGFKLAVQEQLDLARESASENRCEGFLVLSGEEDVRVAWEARKQVAPSMQAMKQDPSDLFLNTDAAVPIGSLASMVDWTNAIVEEAGLHGCTLGHVGDGKPCTRSRALLTVIRESLKF